MIMTTRALRGGAGAAEEQEAARNLARVEAEAKASQDALVGSWAPARRQTTMLIIGIYREPIPAPCFYSNRINHWLRYTTFRYTVNRTAGVSSEQQP